MKADKVIIRILKEIQAEVKAEKGIDISITELGKITHSQVEAIVFSIKKGLNVRMQYITNFVRKNSSEVIEGKKRLKELKDTLSKEEFKAKELEMKLSRIKKQKERNNGNKLTSLEKLIGTPDINKNSTIFDDILLEDV